jgi:hypothetical protein
MVKPWAVNAIRKVHGRIMYLHTLLRDTDRRGSYGVGLPRLVLPMGMGPAALQLVSSKYYRTVQ